MAKKAKKAPQSSAQDKPQNLGPMASAASSDTHDVPHDFIKDQENQEDDSFQNFEGMPMQLPPDEVVEAEEGFGASTWYNNKKISSMWASKNTRNCYAYVAGMGWKKISTKNNSVTRSLNALLCHAYDGNKNTKLKLDNNIIVEAYVW